MPPWRCLCVQRFGFGLDASIESRAQKSAPREFSPSLRQHPRVRFGVLMYLGLPSPAPSVLEFSQSLDGLFLTRFACLVSYRRHPWDSKSSVVSLCSNTYGFPGDSVDNQALGLRPLAQSLCVSTSYQTLDYSFLCRGQYLDDFVYHSPPNLQANKMGGGKHKPDVVRYQPESSSDPKKPNKAAFRLTRARTTTSSSPLDEYEHHLCHKFVTQFSACAESLL